MLDPKYKMTPIRHRVSTEQKYEKQRCQKWSIYLIYRKSVKCNVNLVQILPYVPFRYTPSHKIGEECSYSKGLALVCKEDTHLE